MGIPLNQSFDSAACLNLTPREIEICALHFIDQRPEPLIADWLGITLQNVRQHVARALQKQPKLKTLHKKIKRPKIIPFSQLKGRNENGPFNPDEL